MQEIPEKVVLPGVLVRQILDYLANRPWKESAALIAGIGKAVQEPEK